MSIKSFWCCFFLMGAAPDVAEPQGSAPQSGADGAQTRFGPTRAHFHHFFYIFLIYTKTQSRSGGNTSACPHIEQDNMKTILTTGVFHESDSFIFRGHAGRATHK